MTTYLTHSLGTAARNNSLALGGSLGAGAAGLLGGPWALPVMAGIGAFTSFLGANASERRFRELEARYNALAEPEHMDRRFRENLKRFSGTFSASQRGERALAEARGDATVARFRRAGLSGVGESVASGVRAGVSLGAQRARDSFRLAIQRNTAEQIQQERRALLALMGTPHGGVSPTAAALGGAGAGLEAVQNARFAEQFFGARNTG